MEQEVERTEYMGRSRVIREILENLGLPKDSAPSSFDLIGDIIVLKPPFKLRWGIPVYYKDIAIELLKRLKYAKTVVVAISPVEGEFRTRRIVFLAGERKTKTIYKEFGCKFLVDVEKAYISPRLSYEHIRLSKLVKEGETVVNMFAGVGGFSIIIGFYSRPSKVYSIDKNPVAYELMKENVKLNKLEGIVIPLLGDAREVIREKLIHAADRVLMPLPNLDESFYKSALEALRGSGYIHVYEFSSASDPVRECANKVLGIIEKLGAKAEIDYSRIVRSVGPRKYQVVLDVRVTL